MNWIILVQSIILICPKRIIKHAIPHLGYPKNTLGSITYLLTCVGVLRSPPEPTMKSIPSLRYFIIKHHGSTLFKGIVHGQNYSIHSQYPSQGILKNTLGSITYLLKLGRVFHILIKTYKQSNTLFGIFSKHYGLNYFGLDYQRCIANG